MADAMGQRKQAVLRAVTDDYISTAEPVGSRTIARKHGLESVLLPSVTDGRP